MKVNIHMMVNNRANAPHPLRVGYPYSNQSMANRYCFSIRAGYFSTARVEEQYLFAMD